MKVLDLVIGLSLGIFGTAIIAYLTIIILAPLLRLKPIFKGQSKVQKAGLKVKQSDELISAARYKEALAELRKAIVLDVVGTREAIDRLREHHQSILSRCLVIAEELGSRTEGLAETEQLMAERNELLTLLIKAEEALNNFTGRRASAGKAVPKWSKGDFQGKITEIKKELTQNQAELKLSLATLFSSIERGGAGESITYH